MKKAFSQYVTLATQSFAMPDICLRLRGLLDDTKSDINDIGKLISVDPSLSGKILRLANSALFRFPSQVTSVEKAVMVIGGEALYNLVIAETASSAFKHFSSPELNVAAHWERSVYCGMVAKYLAQQLKLRGNERFFVMGILQNFSEMVIAKASPERYRKYLNDDSNTMPWEKQQQHFGFSFALCSGTILEHWKLPLTLHFPVGNLHNNDKQSIDIDVALLACAERLMLKQQFQQVYGNIDMITPEQAGLLGLDAENLGNAINFADKETGKVASSIK